MSYLWTIFCPERCLAFLAFISVQMLCSAQGNESNDFSSLENRAFSLSERLNAHELLIAEILSRPDPPLRAPRPVPPTPEIIEPSPRPGIIPGGRLPTPRNDQSQTSQQNHNTDTTPPTPAPQWGESEIPFRNDGYYLGIISGNVWPLNSGSKRGGPMGFENGSLFGVFLGRDFGTIRVEVEHDAIYYNQRNGNGSAGIHPVLFRCIFEKELGRRVDLRAGVGSGITLAKLNDGGNSYRDGSFCYDFLLGTGIRFNESLALNLDYRYFLTAASDHYMRLQSSLLTASLQFDL